MPQPLIDAGSKMGFWPSRGMLNAADRIVRADAERVMEQRLLRSLREPHRESRIQASQLLTALS